ncbi:hypothetical protein GALL_338890 [mine drainage metagenome]|jgi:hypothetical protein|uniref:Uncharacterized protein n=1 Tax=mine drainage metagenome TaxID=410659 RepID=A0A1J5QWX7_9ZZZZ
MACGWRALRSRRVLAAALRSDLGMSLALLLEQRGAGGGPGRLVVLLVEQRGARRVLGACSECPRLARPASIWRRFAWSRPGGIGRRVPAAVEVAQRRPGIAKAANRGADGLGACGAGIGGALIASRPCLRCRAVRPRSPWCWWPSSLRPPLPAFQAVVLWRRPLRTGRVIRPLTVDRSAALPASSTPSPTSATGGESPNNGGESRSVRMPQRGFRSLGVSVFGGPGGGAERLAGRRCRSLNPVSACHPV